MCITKWKCDSLFWNIAQNHDINSTISFKILEIFEAHQISADWYYIYKTPVNMQGSDIFCANSSIYLQIWFNKLPALQWHHMSSMAA